jgi:hypothetical protein
LIGNPTSGGASDYESRVGQRPYRPFSTYLPADLQEKLHGKGGSLPPTTIRTGKSYDPLSADIDTQWAGKSTDGQKFNSYYDYYFSGEDVKVYIDGLFDPEHELDIASFSFVIKQEKQPLYGFWSYNYDAMMVGTRLISGEMVVYTRYPGRMRDLLTSAADQRVLFNSDKPGVSRIQSYLTGNNEQSLDDEKNLQRYWKRSNLDRLTADNDQSDNRNIFSSHPPFNFIVKYGTQEGSVSTVGRNLGNDSIDNLETLDRLMATDYNERLVKPSRGNTGMDIVLQDVHLTSMGTSIAPGGQVMIESYQFISRDMYISNGNLRNTQKSVLSTVDSTGIQKTPTNIVQPPLAPGKIKQLKDILEQYDDLGLDSFDSSGGGFSGGGGGGFSGGGASQYFP